MELAELKKKMHGNADDANLVMESLDSSTVQNSDNENIAQNESQQVPVRIGNWTVDGLGGIEDPDYKRPEELELPDRPDALVDRSKLSWENTPGFLGTTHADCSIVMGLPNAERAAITRDEATKRYLNGENLAQIGVFLHEVNHAKDAKYLTVSPLYHTPTNAVRMDNLTENVSHCVPYLALANYYKTTKEQGIETIDINGETKPLSYILDAYPGLRKTYEQYGLDLKNPQSVARYVKLGMDYKIGAQDAYDKQMYGSFQTAGAVSGEKSWETRVDEAKHEDEDWDRISHKMVSKVYIGMNTYVDLSPSYATLSNMKKQDVYQLVEKQSGGQEHVIPSDNIVALDNYMNRIHIPDEEKKMYLDMNFFAIAERDPNADPEIKKLMLQSQYITGNNYADITYADGTSEMIQKPLQNFQYLTQLGRQQ